MVENFLSGVVRDVVEELTSAAEGALAAGVPAELPQLQDIIFADGHTEKMMVPLLQQEGHDVVGLDSGYFADCVLGPLPDEFK